MVQVTDVSLCITIGKKTSAYNCRNFLRHQFKHNCVLGAQKKCLIEMVLLRICIICFG